jgi:flagellar protein FlaJ
MFNRFIQYPLDKSVVASGDIERDILFAARDLVISMRSGMPLFNAITAVSTGYGAASLEFAKIVELVQLGTPIEQAIDEVSTRSKSKTFKRIMLQATVSLKAGADVVGALQGVVDEVMQERVIELRRYGQRLNALAMFYMLFGVIFPSMGIAVAAILTTFINIITLDQSTLTFALIGIFFLQVIFLNIMRSSRPTFAM